MELINEVTIKIRLYMMSLALSFARKVLRYTEKVIDNVCGRYLELKQEGGNE